MNDPIGLSWLDSYGNWMNDLTGGLYGSAGDYLASQITPYSGVSGLANASDTTLFVATAGVSTVAVVGTMYAAPAIATAAVSYGGPLAEAAAMNPEIIVGLAYSAYEIFNSVYQGKMSIGEAAVNGLMTWLSFGAPGIPSRIYPAAPSGSSLNINALNPNNRNISSQGGMGLRVANGIGQCAGPMSVVRKIEHGEHV